MRELYSTSGPGRFQGEPPIVRYLYERVVLAGFHDGTYYGSDYIYDLVGRWVLWVDGVGFVNATKYATRDEAKKACARTW